jgi:glycosyltransferase involved in cell wall biosynthesis
LRGGDHPLRNASLYICYYDLGEPLVQTQVLPYLRALVAAGFEIHLLTFERRRWAAGEEDKARAALLESGIRWSALRYHARPSLPATVYDIVVGAAWTVAYCLRQRIRIVHARSHVPAAMGLVAKRLLGARLLFDMRGLLAEEYLDAGHWEAGGLKFRLTKAMERRFFRRADAMVMLTHRIRDELTVQEPALRGRAGDIEVIPCCVDIARFGAEPRVRDEYRSSRGWSDRVVLTYVGKLGTWYLPREMAAFFGALKRADPRAFFAVLTQSPPEPMAEALRAEGIGGDDAEVRYVPPAELPAALAACDAGISFIRASYSKRASSPTKVGEYLAAGLPVVTNAGVGDVDALFDDTDAGVVTRSFDRADLDRAAEALLRLVARPDTRERCRALAANELGLDTVGGPRYVSLLRRLAGSTDRP